MRAFTSRAADAVGAAGVYLTISNLAGTPDELIAVRSPVSRHVVLTESAIPGAGHLVVTRLAIPANGILSLSPLASDVVLENPVPLEAGKTSRRRWRSAMPGRSPSTRPSPPRAPPDRPPRHRLPICNAAKATTCSRNHGQGAGTFRPAERTSTTWSA